MTWQEFVVAYGWKARGDHLAYILGQPESTIANLRATGVCRRGQRRSYGDLFALWHGRPPSDDEWPAPRKLSCHRSYEWQARELKLVASLAGRMGPDEIRRLVNARLQKLTGDPKAGRTRNAVQCAINRLGLKASDVVGGITIREAARQIRCSSILYNDIACKRLRAIRIGRLLVIPHEAFEAWKAKRVFPPKGFVPLAPLKKRLGIRSDKLSEWARAGHIPGAVRCNPYGTRAHSTQFGTWWVPRGLATKLLADRRVGRPMPWHGQPDESNLTITWRLWQKRKHPADCGACQEIWGPAGPPATFEEYSKRYPPLTHGAKRHLTRPWSPGITLPELSREAHVPPATVLYAIRRGVLRARKRHGRWYITRTDATRWLFRRCPTGDSAKSWMSVSSACRFYGFTRRALRAHIDARRLRSMIGENGPMRGVEYVLRQQVRELRDADGFSEQEAARRVGVSVARLRVLLRGVWSRGAGRIPYDAVNTAIKRLQSNAGFTIAQAARRLGKSIAWVRNEIIAGTVRVLRSKWNKHRLYISAPMFKRLQAVARRPPRRERWSSEWMLVSDAALLAGVCTTMLVKWSNEGEIAWRLHGRFRRYHRRSVMKRARRYWAHEVRFKRATPPAWLQAEKGQEAA